MDLSVIVTAHSEGIVAHKTMLSLFRALKEVPKIKYEIIVHIDRGDEPTKEYFNRYKDDKSVKIVFGDFGDLGLSRNNAMKHATGKYIQIIDADDIIGASFFKQAFEAIKVDDSSLYHPEYVYFFGDVYAIKVQTSAKNKDQAAQLLLSENEWCSMVFGKKELFTDTPYRATANGFGHEDWMFNIDTTEKGILHKIMPGSVLFYRKAGASLVTRNADSHVTQQYSNLFSFETFENYEIEKDDSESKRLTKKEKALYYYQRIRSNRKINYFITPVARVAKKITGIKMTESGSYLCDKIFQGDFLNEVASAEELDNLIVPTEAELSTLDVMIPSNNIAVTERFIKVAKVIDSKKIGLIFFVPWLTAGGADKAIINYAKAICEIKKDSYVLVIGMQPSENEWAKELPNNALFVDYNELAKDLSRDDRELLLTRVITQTNCKRLHIINSHEAYSWVKTHINYVKNYFTVSASFFAREQTSQYRGLVKNHDYADPYLIRIHDVLKFIATDNEYIHSYLINDCGIDPKKVVIHYQPSMIEAKTDSKKKNNGKIHILWASRVCKEKNPELLIKIAKKLPVDKYQIDMFGILDPAYTRKEFSNISTLSYHGAYSGIEELEPSSYDLFLYTSVADGLPNVLLEIAQYGLPIIASNAGGICDIIIDGKTGLLIDDLQNEDAYIDAINKLSSDSALQKKLADNAKHLVEKRHSWDAFLDTVKKDFLN